ncbi:replication-relaxation family protein [Kineosporia sp. NBRC 101677]|uniref:replication-relaxation family protein n=1 Tax=Kineosporia sp. NBRC 101677 TaxID=3032197 RepID=UPI00255407C0|nr:replication-relaxation family protein [Kineosporia sp. NBRC 101677]
MGQWLKQAWHLQARDEVILLHLYRHATLTTAQIGDLVAASPHATRRRLGLLQRQGWIDRFQVRRAGLLLPVHWVLADFGNRWAASYEHDKPMTARQLQARNEAVAGSSQLAHTDGIHDFFVELIRAGRILSGPDDETTDSPPGTGNHPARGRFGRAVPPQQAEPVSWMKSAQEPGEGQHPPGCYRLARWWSPAHTANTLDLQVRPDGHGVWEYHRTGPVPRAPSSHAPATDPPITNSPGTVPAGADSTGTDLPGTVPAGADSTGTDLPGTVPAGADSTGTDLPGTDLPGTDSPGTGPSATKPSLTKPLSLEPPSTVAAQLSLGSASEPAPAGQSTAAPDEELAPDAGPGSAGGSDGDDDSPDPAGPPAAELPGSPRPYRVGFYLEYDRGTETLERVVGKVGVYQRLRDERVGPDWLLLFVLPTPGRELNVHRALNGFPLSGSGHVLNLSFTWSDLQVFTTNQHQIADQEPLGPAGAVWWRVPPPWPGNTPGTGEPAGPGSGPRLTLAQLPATRALRWYLDPGPPRPTDDPLHPLREQARRTGGPPRPQR